MDYAAYRKNPEENEAAAEAYVSDLAGMMMDLPPERRAYWLGELRRQLVEIEAAEASQSAEAEPEAAA